MKFSVRAKIAYRLQFVDSAFYVIDGIYALPMHLLAKLGPLTLWVFVENEAISSWAVSKLSTNTELETDISRNVYFQLYHTCRRIT